MTAFLPQYCENKIFPRTYEKQKHSDFCQRRRDNIFLFIVKDIVTIFYYYNTCYFISIFPLFINKNIPLILSIIYIYIYMSSVVYQCVVLAAFVYVFYE